MFVLPFMVNKDVYIIYWEAPRALCRFVEFCCSCVVLCDNVIIIIVYGRLTDWIFTPRICYSSYLYGLS